MVEVGPIDVDTWDKTSGAFSTNISLTYGDLDKVKVGNKTLKQILIDNQRFELSDIDITETDFEKQTLRVQMFDTSNDLIGNVVLPPTLLQSSSSKFPDIKLFVNESGGVSYQFFNSSNDPVTDLIDAITTTPDSTFVNSIKTIFKTTDELYSELTTFNETYVTAFRTFNLATHVQGKTFYIMGEMDDWILEFGATTGVMYREANDNQTFDFTVDGEGQIVISNIQGGAAETTYTIRPSLFDAELDLYYIYLGDYDTVMVLIEEAGVSDSFYILDEETSTDKVVKFSSTTYTKAEYVEAAELEQGESLHKMYKTKTVTSDRHQLTTLIAVVETISDFETKFYDFDVLIGSNIATAFNIPTNFKLAQLHADDDDIDE